jgi:hypothetical protein
MRIGLVGWVLGPVILGGYIDFAPNDRFNAAFPGRLVKINDAVHITVIGNSQAVHTEVLGFVD